MICSGVVSLVFEGEGLVLTRGEGSVRGVAKMRKIHYFKKLCEEGSIHPLGYAADDLNGFPYWKIINFYSVF